jgi:hypothetical protein
MIFLSRLLETKFGLSFRISEAMHQTMVLNDFQQMLSRDIAACSSPGNVLRLRIHPDPQNHLPYRLGYCYCFHHTSQRMNDLFREFSLKVLCHAKRYQEALIISKQVEQTLPSTLNFNL